MSQPWLIRPVTIYLAGAIRNDHPEDIAWREEAIARLGDVAVLLNPLAGKRYNAKTRVWTLHGRPPESQEIVRYDFWGIDIADILIFNLLALGDGYPNLGTLIEFGRATARSSVRFAILPKAYTGHGNARQFVLHPFLGENAARIFTNVADCLEFVRNQVLVMSGRAPHYGRA